MKTSIIIKGQISGNHTLAAALSTYDSEKKKLQFNSFEIVYPTKARAIKALSEAFKRLKEEEPNYYKDGGFSYTRAHSINYDASRAYIL